MCVCSNYISNSLFKSMSETPLASTVPRNFISTEGVGLAQWSNPLLRYNASVFPFTMLSIFNTVLSFQDMLAASNLARLC